MHSNISQLRLGWHLGRVHNERMLNEVHNREELVDWLVYQGMRSVAAFLTAEDFQDLENELRQQLAGDPYMDAKLEWLATFLVKQEKP